MTLSVGTILWAKNRPGDHNNHLHVEPPTRMAGIPPTTNPGMTAGVKVIFDALEERFGPGAYFVDAPVGTAWTHMGGWNRRSIAGSSSWSQHAWWNALDIGPYYGTVDQQVFYDFLTGIDQGDDEMALTDRQLKMIVDMDHWLAEIGSDGTFPRFVVPWFRKLSGLSPEALAELEESDEVDALEAKLDALLKAGGGTAPSHTHTAEVTLS